MTNILKSVLLPILICSGLAVNAQSKGKAKEKEKAPTKSELEQAMKEAQQMMDELDPEAKKMMDSMGIKVDFKAAKKNAAAATDEGMKAAFEDENRIVPRKDAARIAAIAPTPSNDKMSAFISSTHSKVMASISPDVKATAAKLYTKLAATNSSAVYLGNAAVNCWLLGYPEAALFLMGKACEAAPGNTNNISNYAAMLSMLGGQDLALPLLLNLNKRFPKNSTLLNNIGQAWFGLGDIPKAEKYIDSALNIYPSHPQANVTKASIEENKGNTAAAIAAMKRSVKRGYTDEKEEKLRKLGYKAGPDDFPIPGPKKADPLNLGGFFPPAFPRSVAECIALGKDWKAFRASIDSRLEKLKEEEKKLQAVAEQAQQDRMQRDIRMVNAAMTDPSAINRFASVTLYGSRASRKLKMSLETYAIKLENYSKRVASWISTEGIRLEKEYNDVMAKLRDEEFEQSGEGKANADFCPKYRDASNKFLKAYNGQTEVFFKEYLQIEKEMLNESGHWELYIHWAEAFELRKNQIKQQWLKDLYAGPPATFKSITEFDCVEPLLGKLGPLANFDDVACQYHTEFKLPMGKLNFDCSKSVGEFDAGVLAFKMQLDADKKNWSEKFVSCTVEVGAKIDRDVEVGPVNVGAEAGVRVGVEVDRGGMKDVYVTGGAEGGVKIGDLGPSGGMEGKISIISGKGSIGGAGIFKK
ncbi:MAG: tetratricopeptide repeat protein [Pseudobacter sp.]|uniref:tetratricopeptide repeat protein n=1 Tax=Pseudobacter sp. TaxID=2045420 RepID=UPI003F7EDFA0